jgi:Flp pilus assembly protein TadG
MYPHAAVAPILRSFAAHRSAAVSLLFATMVIPLLLIVGIAVDFSFYITAHAQLDMAADSAAMHAVRAAALATQNSAPSSGSTTNYQYAGTLAGQQWFAAQAVPLPGVSALTGTSQSNGATSLPAVSVSITYTAPKYTATVTYSGKLKTIFGGIAGVTSWPITGTATSTLGYNYVDIAIMIDNSQSMLIGATQSDVATMNVNTPCAVVTPTASGATPGLGMGGYSYYLNGPGSLYGQGTIGYNAGQTMPVYSGANGGPPSTSQYYCDPGYNAGTPGLAACKYPPQILYGTSDTQYYRSAASGSDLIGSCKNGGGATGAAGPHTPQSPCAFACHQNASGGDWYALARNLNVTLRLDVVQNAAQSVIQQMEQYSPAPQTLLGIGVFTFNTAFQPVYPCTTTNGCTQPFSNNLASAYSSVGACSGTQTTGCLVPPISGDSPQTDFANVFSQAATVLAGSAGDGSTAAKAIKNLFLVTDGITDWPGGGSGQVVGPIDMLVVNPCQSLKNQGYTIYVLYTPYYPIPTWTYGYGQNIASPVGTYPAGLTLAQYVTDTNHPSFPDYNAKYPTDPPVNAALRACASSPNYFYTASDQTGINTAMTQMLASALNAAARVTN